MCDIGAGRRGHSYLAFAIVRVKVWVTVWVPGFDRPTIPAEQ